MVMGTPWSGPHTCLRASARSAARARLRAPSTSVTMMAFSEGLCFSTRERYRSSSSRQPIFFLRISAASAFAGRNGVASILRLLLAGSDVDLDFLDRQEPVVVRVHRFEVLEERVDILVKADPAVALARDRLESLGTGFLELDDRQVAALVLVAEEKRLDNRLVELLAVDLAVAVLVVVRDPLLDVQRWRRLRQRRAAEHEGAHHPANRDAADQCAHDHPSTFQLPSGWRQAVP